MESREKDVEVLISNPKKTAEEMAIEIESTAF